MPLKTEQLIHENTPFKKETFPFVLVCDGINSPANAGSLFRLADALGIAHIYFCNTTIQFDSTRLKRTASSSEKLVPYSPDADVITTLQGLKDEGYHLIGLELTTTSKPLASLNEYAFKKIALVLGHERYGICEDVLNILDHITYIPMRGKNSSMNVSQAAAIAAYQLINNPNNGK